MKKGLKFDLGKDRWELLPIGPVREIVRIMTYGAKKYDADNWQELAGFNDRYYAAAMRHLTAWRTGEKLDPESGLSHLAHAACNLVFLLWGELRGNKTTGKR